MYDIEKLKNYLNIKRPIPASVLEKIYDNIKIEYTYNSNAIEGNSLTLKETEVVLEYGITVKGKPLKDHIEAKNQAYALDFLKEEVKLRKEIDKKLIKEFHQIIIGDIDREIAGKFRTYPVTIKASETKTSSPLHIEEELDKLIKWYNSDQNLNTIEKVAIFHSEFEKIHPFGDGNGRTGRLLMNFELMKEGYPITIIKNEDRLEYYNSLEKAQTKEDYKDIIKFIHSNVEKSIIKNLEMLEENWKEKYNNELKKKKNSWAKTKENEKDKENER
jgi:Fic family protein